MARPRWHVEACQAPGELDSEHVWHDVALAVLLVKSSPSPGQILGGGWGGVGMPSDSHC